jgi:hypothetical protein
MADFEFPGEDTAADDGLEPKKAEPIVSDGGESEPLPADSSTVPSTSAVPSPATVPPTTSVPSPTTAVAPDNSVPYYPEQDPIEPDYDEPAPQRLGARGAIAVGARILAGTVGTAVAVGVVAAAGWLPLPSIAYRVPATSVTPVATDQERVCAGPVLRLGTASGDSATQVSSIGYPVIDSAASSGTVGRQSLQSTDDSFGVAPFKITLPPDAAHPQSVPRLAASQTQSVSNGDIVGLSAAECREASGDSWLVGGATVTGRTTLLTMSNPGTVVATVTVSIYTEKGVVNAVGADGVVVPPGGQRVLSLAGFAPGAISPVIRVQSTGSQVVSNLQESVVRTLDPGGVDIVGTGTGPSKTTVIPGVVLSGMADVMARAAADGNADLLPALRLLAPGTASVKARITVTPETGTAKPTTINVTLNPAIVSEVSLGAFQDGTYSITVNSDAPVIAGARASTIGSTGATDLAWFSSTALSAKTALVAVADGPSPTMHLANSTTATASVTVKAQGVPTTTVSVPAGKTVAVPIAGSMNYTVASSVGLRIAVSYFGDGALASFGVTPSGPNSQPITVYPGRPEE